jgi:alpha-glucosidase
MTDENARQFEIELSFLDRNKTYIAEIYRDSDDADWESNPYGFVTETKEVTSEDQLVLDLAPGGGQAIRFRALD